MKYSFLLLLFATSAQAQQSTLHGTVAVFNSQFETGKRQYVANAQVEEDFGKAQATTTAADGSFRLSFVGIKDQEKVFYSVKKTGFEVVNSDALQAIAGQMEIQQVFMAPQGKIEENRLNYLDIIARTAEKAWIQRLDQFKKAAALAQADSVQQKHLYEIYAKCLIQINKMEEITDNLAERFARANLDEESMDYQNAFHCLLRKEVDSALLYLRGRDLENTVAEIMSEQNLRGNFKVEYTRPGSEGYKKKIQTINALNFEAALCQIIFQFDQTERLYSLALTLDSANMNTLSACADVSRWFKQNEKALILYNKALISTDKQQARANLFNKIGLIYSDNMDSLNAAIAYSNALGVYKSLVHPNSTAYELALSEVLYNFGVFYLNSTFDLDKAKYYLSEALTIREKWARDWPVLYGQYRINTIGELSQVYKLISDTTQTKAGKAEPLSKAAELYEQLYLTYKGNEQVADQYISICGSLAWYQIFAKQNREAEKSARKALEIDPSKNWIKINLAHALLFQNKYQDAESIYLELKTQKDEAGKSYGQTCIDDLYQIEAAGITHPDISRIRILLQQK